MQSDFVTLSCPTCGGKLQITPDLDRFACAHCGNEHVVRRGGGVISLKPVEGLLERTASELAIRRLERDIYTLEREVSELVRDIENLSIYGRPNLGITVIAGVWLAISVVSLILVAFSSNSPGAGLIGGAAAPQDLSAVFEALACSGALPLAILVGVQVSKKRYAKARATLDILEPALKAKMEELGKRRRQLKKHKAVVDG